MCPYVFAPDETTGRNKLNETTPPDEVAGPELV